MSETPSNPTDAGNNKPLPEGLTHTQKQKKLAEDEATRKRKNERREKLLSFIRFSIIGATIGLIFSIAFKIDRNAEINKGAFQTPLLEIERRIRDGFFKIRGNLDNKYIKKNEIIFLDIDDASLEALGSWPLPRNYYTEALERLKGAKTVGFDVFFLEKSEPGLNRQKKEAIEDALDKMKKDKFSPEAVKEILEPFFLSDDRQFGLVSAKYDNATFAYFSPRLFQSKSKMANVLDRLIKMKNYLISEFSKNEKKAFEFLTGDHRTALDLLQNNFKNFKASDFGFVGKLAGEELLNPYIDEFTELISSDETIQQLDEKTDILVADPIHLMNMRKVISQRMKIPEVFAQKVYEEWKDKSVSDQVWEAFKETGKTDLVGFVNKDLMGFEFAYDYLIEAYQRRTTYLMEKYFIHRTVNAEAWDPDTEKSFEAYKDFIHAFQIKPPLLSIANGSKHMAFVQIDPDSDGVVRKFPTLKVFFPEKKYELGEPGRLVCSLGMALLLDYLESNESSLGTKVSDSGERFVTIANALVPGEKSRKTIEIPVDEHGQLIINWAGLFEDRDLFEHYSFSDLLADDPIAGGPTKAAQEIIDETKGKIVVIGLTAIGTHDYNPNPLSPRQPLVSAHGNFMNTVLANAYLKNASDFSNYCAIISFSILLAILVGFLQRLTAFIAWILPSIFYFFGIYWLFANSNLFTNASYTASALLFTFLVVLFYRYMTEERKKQQTKGVLQHYLSPEVVDEVLQDPDSLKLGGDKRELTAFFSDIQGFSTISEQIGDPEKLVRMINVYMDALCEPIQNRRGCIDKFIDDAIVAFWGAAPTIPNHAEEACLAALEARDAEIPLRRKLVEDGFPEIFTRIGLNTGEMLVGNMGSSTKFNFTIMGDPVNLAARLEGANKNYGTFIMIGERTFELAKRVVEARELDLIAVKGKTEPTRVYELVSEKGKLSEEQNKGFELFVEGRGLYREQKFKEAKAKFKEVMEVLPGDPPSQTYIERCQILAEKPPGENWDGVWRLTTK